MNSNNSWIVIFFASANKYFILNILYVLRFMLMVPEHQSRILEIMTLIGFSKSIQCFADEVEDAIIMYENSLKDNPDLLMREHFTGSGITVIQDTPVYWLFMSLYWGYGFRINSYTSILKVYDWRIGGIILTYLLYFLKMKEKEASMGSNTHIDSFYSDLVARLVRIVDILIALSGLNSHYINRIFFPDTKDLAVNFFNAFLAYPWINDAFSVVEVLGKGKKKFIRFLHEHEGINCIIATSRMTKKGSLKDFEKSHNSLMKLYNLDSASSKSNYSVVRHNNHVRKEKEIHETIVVLDELTEQLIYDDGSVPQNTDADERLEARTTVKVCRRDTKPIEDKTDTDEAQEYVIPNGYVQSKRNRAFSSKFTKKSLLLSSDYDIPVLEHLKMFIKSLIGGKDA